MNDDYDMIDGPQLTPDPEAILLVMGAYADQQAKHGARPSSIHRPWALDFNRLRVLMEEVGEVSMVLAEDTSIGSCERDHLKTELAQVASVCLAWLNGLLWEERNMVAFLKNGVWPDQPCDPLEP